MKADIVDEHRWLQQLAGTWRMTFDPAVENIVWTETVRSLDGAWIIAESTGTMPGGTAATNILSLGYDPAKERYVGSFVSSAMANLWVYEGTLDESGKVLTLNCEGPDFEDTGRIAPYQDIMTIKDENTRNFSSRTQSADGSWKHIMSCDYTRISDV